MLKKERLDFRIVVGTTEFLYKVQLDRRAYSKSEVARQILESYKKLYSFGIDILDNETKDEIIRIKEKGLI